MKTIALKLVLRSWWRNKTFSVISIVSLAIGIACTNLLAAFVIYEYNIEGQNPVRELIYLVKQDNPMKSGERNSFAGNDIPVILKEKYSEVIDFLRVDTKKIQYMTIGDKQYEAISILAVDSSFPQFFPCQVISGDISKALDEPGKIALTEKIAQLLYGTKNPIGQYLTIHSLKDEAYNQNISEPGATYQIAAIFREREQSFLKFEALTKLTNTDDPYNFPVVFIRTNQPIDSDIFAARLKADKIPTIQGENGRYYFETIRNSYFSKNTERNMFINHRQPILLYIGLTSALLILLIACFNYINLNFSRLIQQVRMIHLQKLMGAEKCEINRQLFLDTFLTVLIAVLLSLLIIHDLIPVFNSIVSGNLKIPFFFNGQVLPVICIFILLLSIIPALYMSRKITGLSTTGYNAFFSGNRKRKIITSLSVIQYIISIVLVIATITVNKQIRFIREGGDSYKNLIEIGDWQQKSTYIHPLAEELKRRPEIVSVAMAGTSILDSWIQQMIIKDEKGNETYFSLINYFGGPDLLKTLHLDILDGLQPEQAVLKYTRPVYINRKYVELLVPKGENPIGKPLSYYDPDFSEGYTNNNSTPVTTIAGIIENLYTETLEKEVCPITIQINNSQENSFTYLYVNIGEDHNKSLATIRQAWEKVNPGTYFSYRNVYETFLERNKKTTELSQLLLMYALISLFLTCFGLLGIALYASRQRTKEIGIRKVNGATTIQIMLLLNKQFINQTLIAFLIAIPISWLLMKRWLENFVYHTDITAITFLLAGILVISITLLTVSWYSYKAASGNPVKSLRAE